jgi:hypothetical protein
MKTAVDLRKHPTKNGAGGGIRTLFSYLTSELKTCLTVQASYAG